MSNQKCIAWPGWQNLLYKSFNLRQKICFDFISYGDEFGRFIKVPHIIHGVEGPQSRAERTNPHHILYHRDVLYTMKVQFRQ